MVNLSLSNVTIPNGTWNEQRWKIPVYDVRSPHTLTQAIGYLKYNAHKHGLMVFYRGQGEIYDGLRPSLYRGFESETSQLKRHAALSVVRGELVERHRLLRKLDQRTQEALLQHYGIKTSWVDVVDNVWVALWFACFRARSSGRFGRYLHFERRQAGTWSEDAFIVVVAADNDGTYRANETTEFVDLRREAPSIFLRPHAQHGLLFRTKGRESGRPLDYGSRIVATIRIELSSALEWLGAGAMLDAHTLFPPAGYDKGYSFLLDDPFEGNEMIGAFNLVGA